MTVRVIYMGTPEFAVPTLRVLAEWDGGEVVAVVTREDRPAGRGQYLAASPVKRSALDLGLPVLQPGSLRSVEAQEVLRALAPDVIVVAAFGQILPQAVLDLPPHGCLNVHASLLPRWRGASPISAAILAGDDETGITIMRMDAGLDTGPIVRQRTQPIAPDDTTGTLTNALADMGAVLLIETLPGWVVGTLIPTQQDASQATVTRLLRKEDGRLDWGHDAIALSRQVRACNPWPGAFTRWNGEALKVLSAHAVPLPREAEPGLVLAVPATGRHRVPVVVCGGGALALDGAQAQGKRPVTGEELLRGYPGLEGATLGA
jgi:methionyl-tRNA formyltransferase